MSFLFKYPHSSFEEINLDYILKRIAEIETQIKTIKEEIEGEIFEWVQEQLAPYEEQLNALIEEVNNLSEYVTETLNAYDERINEIQRGLNEQIAGIERELQDAVVALSSLMDTKIESNNIWLLNEISENVGSLFMVINPFTGDSVSIQSMIDTLSEFHITDGITYDTMNTRALTYNQFDALNITYSDLLLHGHSLYQ